MRRAPGMGFSLFLSILLMYSISNIQTGTLLHVSHMAGAFSPCVCRMWQTGDWSLCDLSQEEVYHILITIPWLEGQVHWCDVCPIVQQREWCMPSHHFKMQATALNNILQSHDLTVILVALKQMSASWTPDLLEMFQSPPFHSSRKVGLC